ncbi:SGNH/GDSL hydrolase family protein [Sphingomonas paucimobilis]|uniref:SGNH/GDSL hydrolase family protein n=1 Tax=Sphingomonas paucimobilis TaxID=13689 RepID=UPI003D986E70
MAKISELPALTNPNGTELVPVVDAGGVTKAASMGGLVAGAVSNLAAAIGIETVRAGWQEVVIDSNNRVVSGYHPVIGSYDGGRSALEKRMLVLEGGGEGVEAIARKGGWITCTVDINGRAVRGKHVLFGDFPADDVDAGGGNADWAAKVAELRGLRLRDAPAIHPAPPKIVRRTLTSPLTPAASAEILRYDDPRLTASLPLIHRNSNYPNNEMVAGGWIKAADGSVYAPHFSIRFVTDAPRIDVRYGYTGQARVLVDGQPVSLSRTLDLGDGEDDWPIMCIDFGADTRTIRPTYTVAAGGAGYVEGDVLTVAGTAGDPLRLEVTSVNADGSIRASGLRLKAWGTLTALSSDAVAAMGGTGTGATIKLSGADGFIGHTTRRMRRIEICMGAGLVQLADLRVPKGSTVRPWPVAGPRLMVMQDSYGQVFPDFPQGVWAHRMADMLGIEDVWLNTMGGTGFINGSIRYGLRLAEIAAHLPPSHQPLIFLTQASINDAGRAEADIQAAVIDYWTEAFARLPSDAVMVQTGILRAPGNAPSDAQSAAVRAGFQAVCAVEDPDGKRSFFIETRAPAAMMVVPDATAEWIAGDQAHPTQAGHEYIGGAMASLLLGGLQSLRL